jgi:SAM-dependent methyltransferase
LDAGVSCPRWGNLRRLDPFSDQWGFDRGTPVDRIYIDWFLRRHAGDIRGRVLEVKEGHYANRFGDLVETVDIVDIDPDNTNATLIADLGESDSLPSRRFDCFIFTQTLQYVSDPESALTNAYGTLVPGGTLLVTAPTISMVSPASAGIDRWRFTPAGLTCLLERVCPDAEIAVTGYGNVLASIAITLGLAAEEMRDHEVEHHDPRFPLVVTARVRKPR